MWRKKYTLADNFFMGGFGGSFLNHIRLICACAPLLSRTPTRARPSRSIAVVKPDGVTPEGRRQLADVGDGRHPEIRQRRQPDARLLRRQHDAAALSAERQHAGRRAATRPTPTRPSRPRCRRRPRPTIGDLLSAQGHHLGLVRRRLAGRARPRQQRRRCRTSSTITSRSTTSRTIAPGTAARAEHLRDGGLDGASSSRRSTPASCRRSPSTSRRAISTSTPATPTSQSGDQHIADVIAHLEKSPQWGAHAGRRHLRRERRLLGPRRAAQGRPLGAGHAHPGDHRLAVREDGHVDHTHYDTTSILRFITRRFDLPNLDGIKTRDAAMAARGQQPLGDLSASLNLL